MVSAPGVALVVCLLIHATQAAAYNPLAVSGTAPQVVDLNVADTARSRDIPLRVYLPCEASAAPVVLFSHGLGGSREGSAFFGMHLAGRGYVAVFLQHAGSDESVWKDLPRAQRMAALKSAASIESFLARVADVPAVLDQLTVWQRTKGHPLAGRMDLAHVGMSGHSFGAVTTQAVTGQSFPLGAGTRFTDSRLKAAVVMSPSTPRRGGTAQAFAQVKVPWLLMTGTEDGSPIGDQTPQTRQQVFPALPAGFHFELVLDKAAHSAFTDRTLPTDTAPRNPNHHKVILATSTAFFDATLRGDPAARAWLEGEGPKSVMEPADRLTPKAQAAR
jgi:predicted dienelactone hydrolase